MFEEIKSHDFVKSVLQHSITENRINHAYIFYGNDGVGRLTMAKKFLQYLICENGSACGNCYHCKQFLSNSVSDYQFIDLSTEKEKQKSEITVDQIREIVNDVYTKPYIFDKKMYIINNADKMNVNAQNALLKVFEEPPQYVVFILIVKNISDILPTIQSRGNILTFNPLCSTDIKSILKDKYELIIDDNMAELSNGSVSTALELCNSQEFSELRYNIVNLFSKYIIEKTPVTFLELYKLILDNESKKDIIVNILMEVVYDLSNINNYDLIKNKDFDYKKITTTKISEKESFKIYNILTQLLMRMRSNAKFSVMILSALEQMKF